MRMGISTEAVLHPKSGSGVFPGKRPFPAYDYTGAALQAALVVHEDLVLLRPVGVQLGWADVQAGAGAAFAPAYLVVDADVGLLAVNLKYVSAELVGEAEDPALRAGQRPLPTPP